jgi:PhnB protein
MASVSTYLLFDGNAEEAFTFYKSVFGTEYQGDVMRHGDVPRPEGSPPLDDNVKQMIMNMALPILGGHVLMASDMPPGMDEFTLIPGNNIQLTLQPDTRGEADRLFAALAAGGTVRDPMQEMFWGDYYGSLVVKFGITWLIDTPSKV